MQYISSKMGVFFLLMAALTMAIMLWMPDSSEHQLTQDDTTLTPDIKAALARTLGQEDEDYHITQDLAVDNKKHGYTAQFTEKGITFSPGFTLSVIGPDYLNPIVSDNIVTYVREGYSEWYVNSPFGLEQGFTLTEPITIEVAISDAKEITLHKDAKGASIATNNRTLSYQGLYVFDSVGKQLPATFSKASDITLAINVDDRDAVYPITIDPYVQSQKLTADDGGEGAEFGYDVDINSDASRLVVSATENYYEGFLGQVYVFVRSGSVWELEQKLRPDDPDTEWQGDAVAIDSSGNRIVIGASNIDTNRGAAFIFTRSGTTWTQEAKLVADDGVAGDALGSSVGITVLGDRIVAGAANENSYTGSAYVFSRSGTTWTQEQKLTADDGAASSFFGGNVGIDSGGNRIIVGQTGNYDIAPGAAYIFTRSDTTWTQEQKLDAGDDSEIGDVFSSFFVALDSTATRAVVGHSSENSYTGSAYVFSRSGTTWTQEQKLTADDGAVGSQFGRSGVINPDGSLIVIGATGWNSSVGAAYIFSRSGIIWTQEQRLTADDGTTDDELGNSAGISSDGSYVVLGAHGAIISGNAYQGAAYVFTLESSGGDSPIGSGIFSDTDLILVASVSGGPLLVEDINMYINAQPASPGTYLRHAGSYNITADPVPNYSLSFLDACAPSGRVVLTNVPKTCTVIYTYLITPSPTPSVSPTPTSNLEPSVSLTPPPEVFNTPWTLPITPSPSVSTTPFPSFSPIPSVVIVPLSPSDIPSAPTQDSTTSQEIGRVLSNVIETTKDDVIPIAAPALTAVISIPVLVSGLSTAASSGAPIGFALSELRHLLEITGIKKKRRVWGVIYDSKTKKPIPYTKIELKDQSNRTLETRYADREGRYGFLTSPSSLHKQEAQISLVPVSSKYTFPSKIVTSDRDFIVYDHVYRGESMTVKDSLVNYNIPLDPKAKSSPAHISRPLLSNGMVTILNLGFWIGVVATPLNAFLFPSPTSLTILGLFLIFNLFRISSDLYRPFGLVYDSKTHKPLSYALVTLNDSKGNRKAFSVSDEQGRYFLLTDPGSYTLTIHTPAHISPSRSKSLDLKAKKGWIRSKLTV